MYSHTHVYTIPSSIQHCPSQKDLQSLIIYVSIRLHQDTFGKCTCRRPPGMAGWPMDSWLVLSHTLVSASPPPVGVEILGTGLSGFQSLIWWFRVLRCKMFERLQVYMSCGRCFWKQPTLELKGKLRDSKRKKTCTTPLSFLIIPLRNLLNLKLRRTN